MNLYTYGQYFWADDKREIPEYYQEILPIELPKEYGVN